MLKRMVLLCSLTIFSTIVIARAPAFIPTDSEIRLLPPYCAAKMLGVGEQKWRAILGEDFGHIHHLCYAKNAKRKAITATDSGARRYLYSTAIQNYEYMETHVSKGFALLPEIYLEKADVYRSIDQNAKAEQHYLKAIESKPDYAKSYIQYSRFLTRNDQPDRAREILEQGLKANPDSRALKRRLDRSAHDN